MTKAKSAQAKGKDFEQKVQDCLKSFERKRRTVTLRLYDTRSAGTYLPAQPGDFVCVSYGRAILIEAKSSEKHSSLAGKRAPLTSLFDAEQIAKMRLWRRAGANVWVIFQSQETKRIQVWKGHEVAEAYVTPRLSLDIGACFGFTDIEEACKFMLDIE